MTCVLVMIDLLLYCNRGVPSLMFWVDLFLTNFVIYPFFFE